jgi:hypothetical protein
MWSTPAKRSIHTGPVPPERAVPCLADLLEDIFADNDDRNVEQAYSRCPYRSGS